MKKLILNRIVKFCRWNFLSSWKINLPILFLLLLSGIQTTAQPAIPSVTVRFANPYYDCPTNTYCLDVEFICDTPGQKLFGMNVRFFYDDSILEYLSMGDFQVGYGGSATPVIRTGPSSSGTSFGIAGRLEWFNGTLNLISSSPIFLSTTKWTKLCNICFRVDDPNVKKNSNFCPSVFWDLEANSEPVGYLAGDDGVVMTIVDLTGAEKSLPTTEIVEHLNWQYDLSGNSIGYPVSVTCVSTICGFIPVSNWALFLAFGLMIAASVFIYRKRI